MFCHAYVLKITTNWLQKYSFYPAFLGNLLQRHTGGGELGTGNVVSDTLNLPSLSTALRGGPLKKLWRGAKIKIEQGKQKEKKIVHQKR
jgi:hypothetical protein